MPNTTGKQKLGLINRQQFICLKETEAISVSRWEIKNTNLVYYLVDYSYKIYSLSENSELVDRKSMGRCGVVVFLIFVCFGFCGPTLVSLSAKKENSNRRGILFPRTKEKFRETILQGCGIKLDSTGPWCECQPSIEGC